MPELNSQMIRKLHLLLWCGAIGIVAFVCLNFWSQRNAPLYRHFERQWSEDVEHLESSKKLPSPWFDVKDLEVIGGTPESKDWLKHIQIPIKTHKEGHFKMEVLVVAWEEDGKRGTLVQYNVVDLKSGNNVWELGRTFILSQPKVAMTLRSLLDEFRQ